MVQYIIFTMNTNPTKTNGLKIYKHHCNKSLRRYTVRYKILEGENFGEFGESKEIRQNFLVQIFPLKNLAILSMQRTNSVKASS